MAAGSQARRQAPETGERVGAPVPSPRLACVVPLRPPCCCGRCGPPGETGGWANRPAVLPAVGAREAPLPY